MYICLRVSRYPNSSVSSTPFPVPQRSAVLAHAPFDVPHRVVSEQACIYVAVLKHFEPLPYCLDTGRGIALAERYRYSSVRIERTEFYQSVLCLACDVTKDGVRILFQDILRFLSFGFYNNYRCMFFIRPVL